jgi:glycosyltransferase involved in cell wall biosynthesis
VTTRHRDHSIATLSPQWRTTWATDGTRLAMLHAVTRLSVLLPTRNRREYLRLAIETVRRQDCPDWEIVISDNDSEEDIAGYVAGIGDSRIAYQRTERFISVTENWNRALEASTGDYVVMLGDDDGLMPGYVTKVLDIAKRWGNPDLIYTSALLLTYPGVEPSDLDGSLASYGYASFLRNAHEPFVLSPTDARRAVKHAMQFRLRYGFNMQFAVIGRSLIDRLQSHGAFFQSLFPDYYAMNACFLHARQIVVNPEPLVVIGVTPKSYGFYHANAREAEGKAFLDAGVAERLPGTNINVGWLDAVTTIEREHGSEFGLRANRRRYRWLQGINVYERDRFQGGVPPDELTRMNAALLSSERLVLRAGCAVAATLRPVLPKKMRAWLDYAFRRLLRQYPRWTPPRLQGRYANLLEVFDAAAEGHDVLADV